MDIKKQRRDAAQSGKCGSDDLPEIEAMYPGGGGDANKKGQGSAASDNNIGWEMRAQSWQRGADSNYFAIEAEKKENDIRFGVPYEDNFPAPSDPAGPKNCGARYQTASYDADATLPDPNNFHSNPGYMSPSTGDMAASGNPATGGTARVATSGSPSSTRGSLQSPNSLGSRRETPGGTSIRSGTLGGNVLGRSSIASKANVSLPAAGDVNPGQEGGPLVVTSGYSG
jgi:hypothetical protein